MTDIIKRFKYRLRCKKAIDYLKNIDYPSLIQISNKIQAYCLNEECDFFGEKSYFHHLPLKDKKGVPLSKDNWDLTEVAINEIEQSLQILRNYCSTVSAIYFSAIHLNNEKTFIREILPPWIIFPHYDAMTIGWRMGAGEEYMEIFLTWLDTLSDEQRETYFQTYPIPEYMGVNRFGYNMANHSLRTEGTTGI